MDEKKQIEEMARDVCIEECPLDICSPKDYCDAWNYAEIAIEKGYRKVPKGAVVLTSEEFDEFRKDEAEVKFLKKQIQDQARKETAREIVNFVAEHCDNESLVWLLDEFIAKQYGVEVDDERI